MKKRVRVFDIEWETDEKSPTLPEELMMVLKPEDVNSPTILDRLSDAYGWLVLDMKWEVV